MAKATKIIKRLEVTEEEQRTRDLKEVEDALIKNKDALLESLSVINHMHEKGIISLLNGLFGQGDKVLEILVKTADTPETSNTLKNLLLMMGVLGTLDVKQLEPLLLKVNAGAAKVAEHKDTEEKTSYFDLVRALKDPEINRSITLLMTFLKGMGEKTEHKERSTEEFTVQRKDKGKNLG
ncbi:DUF1641 domain-containing protein [Fictibacillus sp. KU28468]|uniref:DUF1641 domain-containing protein n=1 Tax=Fictibacillus sp. KU28468 TaxID=2991053 RepID=UPI00223E3074|nr:DUF1641 domain-containing protein [Fictibacillus sp. KU28468]UZJ76901.1 DUF1641 domain-containing protein [Fictibacillus sp. KU28468]